MSFQQLSDVIQALFGFEGYHLCEFRFPKSGISLMEQMPEEDYIRDREALVMARHSLEEFEEYPRFTYTYDFGDDWEFQIIQEAILVDHPEAYPLLKKYKGNNLVEDVGGIWGYYDLLKAWEGPKNADPELLEWAGEPDIYEFDPDAMEEHLKIFMTMNK